MIYKALDNKGNEIILDQLHIKEYDFNGIAEYYSYIVESYINGNRKQVKDLINEMCISQIIEFISTPPGDHEFIKGECIKAINGKSIELRRTFQKLTNEIEVLKIEVKKLKY